MYEMLKENMKPTIGRIVIFHLSENEKSLNNGAIEAPAIITRVWSDNCINLKVITDGLQEPIWKTSVLEGTEPFNWSWPVKV